MDNVDTAQMSPVQEDLIEKDILEQENEDLKKLLVPPIDVLNKDCRRSILAILTWVPENVKISARPLNSIGN